MRAIVRFGKQPRLRFISHLDLQRFYQMALNRTGLPIAYTQGFNPHAVMAFASALALGWTSDYEILDFKLSAPMGRKRVEDAVRAALPEDLPVKEVRLVDDRFPSLMPLVYASEYIIRTDCRELIDQIPAYLAEAHVTGFRKSKSGEKEIDMRPMTLELRPDEAGLYARLMLTEQETLKPDLLVKALAARAGIDTPEVRIHRLTLLTKEMKPLMELC